MCVILYIPLKSGDCTGELKKYFPEILNKKAIISIKNNEKNDRCFIDCVLCYIASRIHDQNNSKSRIHLERASIINKYLKFLNLKRITFPVGIREIKFFEKDNTHLKIRINVYS